MIKKVSVTASFYTLFFFNKFFRQKALQINAGKGLEAAMEWLLAHTDDDIDETLKISTTDAEGKSYKYFQVYGFVGGSPND